MLHEEFTPTKSSLNALLLMLMKSLLLSLAWGRSAAPYPTLTGECFPP